jgi:hypothetical protein
MGITEVYNIRVSGAVIIVVGLYLVLWGKSKDDQYLTKSNSDEVLPSAHTLSPMNEKA